MPAPRPDAASRRLLRPMLHFPTFSHGSGLGFRVKVQDSREIVDKSAEFQAIQAHFLAPDPKSPKDSRIRYSGFE